MAKMTSVMAAVVAVAAVVASAAPQQNCLAEYRNGCVKAAGSSGWIQFCAKDKDSTEDADGSDKSCVAVRPFGLVETDAQGKELYSRNNIGKDIAIGTVTTKSLAKECNGTVEFCGVAADGTSALNVSVLPIVVTLPNNKGTLVLDAFTFQNNGTFGFGGLTNDDDKRSVTEGLTKFNVGLSSYSWESSGVSVGFDIVLRVRGGKAEDAKVRRETRRVILGGGLDAHKRWAYKTAAGGNWSWADIDIASKNKGNQQVVSFTFRAPNDVKFTQMSYDPIAGDYGADSSASGVTAVAAAVVAVGAALFAAL